MEKEIDKFDVICFQVNTCAILTSEKEMFGLLSSRRSKLISVAKEKGLQYHSYAPAPSLLKMKIVDGTESNF
jgi:hypothetical protein